MGIDFSSRHPGPELLDQPDIPKEDLIQNLRELEFINRWLGGHSALWKGVSSLWKPGMKMQVVELGSGGGDNLDALFVRTQGEIQGTGVDLKADCSEFAKLNRSEKLTFLTQDYRHFVSSPDTPTLYVTSLFCHHFSKSELISMFSWLRDRATAGFVIADLHRHPVAYHAIRLLTRLFSTSYLVKHDAPLSVLRGFRRAELVEILQLAGISSYTIRWVWAFRWVIVVPPQGDTMASGSQTSANPSGRI